MTPTDYRDAIARIGLSQVGAARFFGVNERTGRRWAEEGPPPPVTLLLRLMLALKISASDAADLLKRRG